MYQINSYREKEFLNITFSYVAPVTNPLAVNEIRRQRDLFEQKKKEKFVEKQQQKNVRNFRNDIQFDDHATYSIHSDIDEGVGVSMHSADVTTAATWGGSTEQSSSDQEDSAVGEEFVAVREVLNFFFFFYNHGHNNLRLFLYFIKFFFCHK